MLIPEGRLTVALAGCGVVGGAFARRVATSQHSGDRRAGGVVLTRVLVQRRGEVRPVWPRAVTQDLEEYLAARADAYVEAIGGIEPALTIARRVLSRGGTFITANKALVARHGAGLERLARDAGGRLGVEATVGGGVPVIRTLREVFAGQPVAGIKGILNGTANFVLTRLEEGSDYPAALRAAQARGLAEADPARDLDGRDVAEKLAILAWAAWQVDPRQVVVQREGLLPDPGARVREAQRVGGRLRLVGECRRTSSGIVATVRPEIVPADSPFGRTVNEENRIIIDLGWGMPIELAGPGAGGEPTAAALWSDLVALGGES